MIGVLALQGAFLEHRQILEKLGESTIELRQKSDLEQDFDGLILVGGESSVQGKLLRDLGMYQPLKEKILGGLPTFGTCAGMILLAKDLDNSDSLYFQTMDIHVVRNAYGRQLGSFQAKEQFADCGEIPMSFIRAPYIKSAGSTVEVLATVDGKIVAAREKNQLVTAFHPEVTSDSSVHQYFVGMIAGK